MHCARPSYTHCRGVLHTEPPTKYDNQKKSMFPNISGKRVYYLRLRTTNKILVLGLLRHLV